MAKMYEDEALKTIRRSKNSISGKKIYLASKAQQSGIEEYRGVYSAGLKLWRAVDFLVNHCNYQIVYEVSGKKNYIDEK